jgi:hypothetical protein
VSVQQQFRVVRIDMWDYRHPTEHVFDTFKEADKKADELQAFANRACPDPTSCYMAVVDDAGSAP